MSALALKKVKVERIDDEETPCNDMMIPPSHSDSQDHDNKFHVLHTVKKERFDEESLESKFTNEILLEFPPYHSVNSYDNKFDVSMQVKTEFSEDVSHEPDNNSAIGIVFEFPPKNSVTKDCVKYSQGDEYGALKKPKIEKEDPQPGHSYVDKQEIQNDKVLKKPRVKQELQSSGYNDYEELFLSVKVREGDKKYQGKRKTDRSHDQLGNNSVHYDTLITTGQVPCKLCGKKYKNSFNLLKHNIEHIKLNINTPEVIRKFQNKQKKRSNKKSERRPCVKESEQKTKLLYHCKYCNKHYKYRSWHKHLETMHSEKKYKCGLCGKKFRCFNYVENHMKMVHIVQMNKETVEKGKMFKCWCGKEYRSVEFLNQHKKERHNMYSQTYTPIKLSLL